jgi:hypothetical protein
MATAQNKLDPLREFLDAVVSRIENLESHCGLSSGASAGSSAGGLNKTPSVRHISGGGMKCQYCESYTTGLVAQLSDSIRIVSLFSFFLQAKIRA